MSIKQEKSCGGVVTGDAEPNESNIVSVGEMFDSSDYTLNLQNVFDNNLISEFEAEWSLRFNFAEIETVDIEGIIPKRYETQVEEDDEITYYIYGQSTSDNISRPSFDGSPSMRDLFSDFKVEYNSQEISSLKTVYQKQNLSDSIKEKVSSISANIHAKMNLNIEQNLNFQKSKVKEIGFKKTSVFEKAPEVASVDTENTIVVTTPVTQGNY